MADNPATTDDIALRWRSLSSDETTVAESLLADAWSILLARVGTLSARLDAATLSSSLVVAVECAMVLRVLRNPAGKLAETIDDYSYTRAADVAAGLLYVSDDELALLSAAGDVGGAFTIRPYGLPGYATSLPLNAFEIESDLYL